MGRLDGKVTLITGTGTGMGRVAAILFAKEGAKVVGVDCVSESGEETLRMIKEAGGESIFVKADISKVEDVKRMIRAAVDTYGKLDVLYNNAAISMEPNPVPLAECEEEKFDKVIDVNLKGVFLAMKYAIPEMIKTGGGSIITTASVAAIQGLPTCPSYSASKAGIVALSKSAAMAYATRNIRINCIHPGSIQTPWWVDYAKSDPEAVKVFLARIPVGRFGKPEEIAHLALFLASDESSFITGTEVIADGGFSAGAFMPG